MDKRTMGIYPKYLVCRSDYGGAPGGKHFGCEYFVLDMSCDKYAIAALYAYANSCKDEYPVLAKELIEKAEALSAKVVKNLDNLSQEEYESLIAGYSKIEHGQVWEMPSIVFQDTPNLVSAKPKERCMVMKIGNGPTIREQFTTATLTEDGLVNITPQTYKNPQTAEQLLESFKAANCRYIGMASVIYKDSEKGALPL